MNRLFSTTIESWFLADPVVVLRGNEQFYAEPRPEVWKCGYCGTHNVAFKNGDTVSNCKSCGGPR